MENLNKLLEKEYERCLLYKDNCNCSCEYGSECEECDEYYYCCDFISEYEESKNLDLILFDIIKEYNQVLKEEYNDDQGWYPIVGLILPLARKLGELEDYILKNDLELKGEKEEEGINPKILIELNRIALEYMEEHQLEKNKDLFFYIYYGGYGKSGKSERNLPYVYKHENGKSYLIDFYEEEGCIKFKISLYFKN